MFEFLQMLNGGSNIPEYFKNEYPAQALNNLLVPNSGFAAAAPTQMPQSPGMPVSTGGMPQGNLRQMMLMQALQNQNQGQSQPPTAIPPMPQVPPLMSRASQMPQNISTSNPMMPQMGMPNLQSRPPRRFLGSSY